MSSSVAPKLSKWPFILGDFLLIGFAIFVAAQTQRPMKPWEAGICLLASIAGAWMCTIPFLREYRATLALSEASTLATTVAKIEDLERIKTQIGNATSQWVAVQEQSTKTVAAAQEIKTKMSAELAEFCAFLNKSKDAEKNHLKLEVEKLRRSEGEWLQVVVHLLDHVFALHGAASRTRQPGLMAQLDQFQFACRDIVRRLGLVPFAPKSRESFDSQLHQLQNSETQPAPGALISEILAPGYTYQQQVVRRALVKVLEASNSDSKDGEAQTPEAGASTVSTSIAVDGAQGQLTL